MVGVFADQNVRDRRFGRQPAGDRTCRRRCLHNAVGAAAASVFGAARHDHPELRRDDVQPFRHVFADAMQAAPAGAGQALGFDHLLDARQVVGQRPAIDRPGPGAPLGSGGIGFFVRMDRSDCRLQILQRQLKLVRVDLLRLAPEGDLLEGGDQLLQPLDPLILAQIARRRGGQHRLQGVDVIGQIGDTRHGADLSDQPRFRPPYSASIWVRGQRQSG